MPQARSSSCMYRTKFGDHIFMPTHFRLIVGKMCTQTHSYIGLSALQSVGETKPWNASVGQQEGSMQYAVNSLRTVEKWAMRLPLIAFQKCTCLYGPLDTKVADSLFSALVVRKMTLCTDVSPSSGVIQHSEDMAGNETSSSAAWRDGVLADNKSPSSFIPWTLSLIRPSTSWNMLMTLP